MTTRSVRCLTALLVSFLLAAPVAASPFTPREWKGTTQIEGGAQVSGKLVAWNRDRNRNFIDDLIDDRDPGELLDVVVDFNRCVTCTDEGEEEILRYLRSIGKVDHVSRIVTFAVVLDVPRSELEAIAARDEVAMVEYLEPAQGMLNVGARAVRARASGTFSPNTAENAFPAIDGTGVNIAVVDSGVDNAGGPGTTHTMFPAGTFVGGANCLVSPCTVTDPDDDQGHGSHVAGIALGRQVACGGDTCRGIAPGAGLVDIKVLNSANSCVGASCIRGLELAITNRNLWNIDVVNVSIGNCTASNGQNAAAQLINTAVSLGMVVAVAAGNSSNCSGLPNGSALINDWASASLAITTAAVNDGNTVPLGNDAVAGLSLRGPRLSDGDGDPRDEQKPEISAPGQAVSSALRETTGSFTNKDGTSMAAPHVAGAAALALQAIPGINPGSVKELMINTAAQSNKPGPHPGYDVGWGFGFLDVFAMLNRATATDVGRPTEPPYAPCTAGWCSPHISTATPPKLNVANTITAQVRNFTGTAANNVRVCFGVYVFSNNFNRFFELGCTMTNFAGGPAPQAVAFPWTPSAALLPPGFPAGQNLHTCIKVSLDYAFDTNFANNEMQRNTSVATASVARVPFRLENNLTETAEIELKVEQPKQYNQEKEHNAEWKVRITDGGETIDRPVFTMDPEDCPKDLVVEVEPPRGTARGDKGVFVVRAVANGEVDFGGIVFEGVVEHVEPTDGHPWDQWPWWVWLLIVLVLVLLVWFVLRRRRRGQTHG